MFPPWASSHRESTTVPGMKAIQSLRQRLKAFSTMFQIFVCLLAKRKKALSNLLVIKAAFPLPAKNNRNSLSGMFSIAMQKTVRDLKQRRVAGFSRAGALPGQATRPHHLCLQCMVHFHPIKLTCLKQQIKPHRFSFWFMQPLLYR